MIRIVSLPRVLCVLAVLVLVAPAAGNTIYCGDCTFGPDDVIDNLTIKAGGTAKLVGTRVRGSIRVELGSELIMRNGAEVEGSILADGARRFDIRNCYVEGNMKIRDTRRIVVKNLEIGGDLLLEDNRSLFAKSRLISNEVGGDILVNENRFTFSQARIVSNDVAGNLEMTENTGGDIIVRRNDVEGDIRCSGNTSTVSGSGNTADDIQCGDVS